MESLLAEKRGVLKCLSLYSSSRAAKQKLHSLLFTELSQFLSVSFLSLHPHSPPPTHPPTQSVCSALWGLCRGHLSRRTGDACGVRCVPPALLHLQSLFLPPADRRPLRPQRGTATVCQRGLSPVCGQPVLLGHRYRFVLCTCVCTRTPIAGLLRCHAILGWKEQGQGLFRPSVLVVISVTV